MENITDPGLAPVMGSIVSRAVRALQFLESSSIWDLDSLVHEGIIVYYRAKRAFDPSRGVKFNTFLTVALRNFYTQLVQSEQRGRRSVTLENASQVPSGRWVGSIINSLYLVLSTDAALFLKTATNPPEPLHAALFGLRSGRSIKWAVAEFLGFPAAKLHQVEAEICRVLGKAPIGRATIGRRIVDERFSSCPGFGKLYDASAPECRDCEVHFPDEFVQCREKTTGRRGSSSKGAAKAGVAGPAPQGAPSSPPEQGVVRGKKLFKGFKPGTKAELIYRLAREGKSTEEEITKVVTKEFGGTDTSNRNTLRTYLTDWHSEKYGYEGWEVKEDEQGRVVLKHP